MFALRPDSFDHLRPGSGRRHTNGFRIALKGFRRRVVVVTPLRRGPDSRISPLQNSLSHVTAALEIGGVGHPRLAPDRCEAGLVPNEGGLSLSVSEVPGSGNVHSTSRHLATAGDDMSRKPDTPEEQVARFLESIERTRYPDGCWRRRIKRRGRVNPRSTKIPQILYKGRRRPSPAVAYLIFNGFDELPVGKPQVNHYCGNSWCHNPLHLYAGTHQDNMDDWKKDILRGVSRSACRKGVPRDLEVWCPADGRKWKSYASCARDLGVDPASVSQFFQRGWITVGGVVLEKVPHEGEINDANSRNADRWHRGGREGAAHASREAPG